MMHRFLPIAFVVLAALSGCVSYKTPGAGISIPAITQADVAEVLARQPAAQFPVHVIAARVQASGYESYSNQGYGEGRYSVVTTRDIETEQDFARLEAQAGIADLGVLSRILLPPKLQTTQELRTAAAQLRGDILLLYTVDTSFRTDSEQLGALQLVSLGFFRNKTAHVTSTCSAVFLDVRTGFVYGAAEATAREEQQTNVWNTRKAIDAARLKAERASFTELLPQIEATWAAIASEYGSKG